MPPRRSARDVQDAVVIPPRRSARDVQDAVVISPHLTARDVQDAVVIPARIPAGDVDGSIAKSNQRLLGGAFMLARFNNMMFRPRFQCLAASDFRVFGVIPVWAFVLVGFVYPLFERQRIVAIGRHNFNPDKITAAHRIIQFVLCYYQLMRVAKF